jgi:NitT/TauT family transport system substrate-binding protein
VTILVRGSPGASTEQKTIPISAILFIIFHHDESLNSKTALLLSSPVFLKNFLTISRFSNVYLINFPNINHAQAVIGLGKGDFQNTLGNNVNVEIFQFNAGPSAIESLLANRIDVSYIGPNPAINGYVVSDGKDGRVIAGATSAGYHLL